MTKREITIAHSPDSDDAFMFYALATKKVESENLAYRHHLNDIETLNQQARDGVWDVTAISFHALPYITEHYALMPCGGSMGDGYGPLVVSSRRLSPGELRGGKIAVPGMLTSAFLAMKLYQPEFVPVVTPFDQIIDAVLQNKVDAGLLIHEGQLTFGRDGLHRVVDLGQWWKEQYGLPLPLGGNVIRKELRGPIGDEIASALRRSVRYAMEHRSEAMTYALQFARDLDPELADRFVGMYVNDYTLDYGPDGRNSIAKFLQLGYEKGFISRKPQVEF
jgi:5,8-dihydroxy-2-naphthoate synthase